MSKYAKGKFAFGFCDRTGFRYRLKDLKDEYNAGVRTGLKVGKDVFDKDHPQNSLGSFPIHDPQALQNSRPTGGESGRSVFSFNPVGDGNGFPNPNSMKVSSNVGTVTVTVS